MARLVDARDQPIEEHARRLQRVCEHGDLDPGILQVEIASLQTHLAPRDGSARTAADASLALGTWALAIITGALAGAAIWGWGPAG
jgi:hypothetical protein